jgi:AcrR family transcriptional regulator
VVNKEPTVRRPRGVRAGLDRDQIIAAAKTLDPAAVTMQAVAGVLGVDRKAVNHHVSDRETLLGLVAMDAFAESFSEVRLATRSHWHEACRIYAMGFAEAVIAIGPLADHLQLGNPFVTTMLEASEVIVRKLIEAGADDETALRGLVLLTNICLAHARDVIAIATTDVPPRPELLRRAMSGHSPEIPLLARIAELKVDTYDKAQLELSIDVFIAGFSRRLTDGDLPRT